MKKCVAVFAFFLSLVSFQLMAQSIANDNTGVMYLYRNETNVGSSLKRGAFAGDHILGDTITTKLNEFEKRYIYYKPGSGAYAVEEKVTLKPQIYKSVKKLDKFYTSQYTSKKLSLTEATRRFGNALDVSLKLINYDTSQVERDLKKINDPAAIEQYLLKLLFRDNS